MSKQPHHKLEEVRSVKTELRAAATDGESRRVEGYAALFSSPTDMGWYEEEIAPGAFDGADLSDVRALFNHDPDNILARTAAGTLQLTIDQKGLKFAFDMPDTTLGNDLMVSINRRDISQCSFAFRVDEQTWTESEGQPDRRTITKMAAVYDVGPVTYPAYEDTDVALRSKPTGGEDKTETTTGFDDEVRADIQYFNQLLQAAK